MSKLTKIIVISMLLIGMLGGCIFFASKLVKALDQETQTNESSKNFVSQEAMANINKTALDFLLKNRALFPEWIMKDNQWEEPSNQKEKADKSNESKASDEVNAEPKNLKDLSDQILMQFEGLANMIKGLSYMLGLGFGIRGILLLHEAAQNNGRTNVSKAVMSLLAGVMMLYLPSMLTILREQVNLEKQQQVKTTKESNEKQ